jgi:hypothetical protein
VTTGWHRSALARTVDAVIATLGLVMMITLVIVLAAALYALDRN